jgi:putative transposase
MKDKTTSKRSSSRVAWESLEAWARGEIESWLQDLLFEEVTELLGREKSERRKPVDSPEGYRNGYGKPRCLTMSIGTVKVRRPRVRDVEERFESRVLPLFKRRTETVSELIPELYLHGLAQGDFDLALRGLLGEKAPLSASTVGRLKQKWQSEYEEWLARPLDELEVVYLWVDGVYVKASLEKGGRFWLPSGLV